MTGGTRRLLRRAYRAIPFKQPLFRLVRRLWRPPERVFRHLHFRGVFRVPVDGASFLLHHHGFQIENEVFWAGLGGAWEPVSMELWTRLARSARGVADVGANHGLYALVAQAVNPDARVTAFEPVPRVCARLRANVEVNGFAIDCIEAAVSDRDGTAVLHDPGTEHVLSVTVGAEAPAGSGGAPVEVATVTLAGLVESGRMPPPDLLKIDVETHEPAVLRGMGPALLAARPTLLIEILTDEVADQVEALVGGLGYRVYDLDERSPPRPLPRVRRSSATNLLLCREEVARALGLG